MTATNKAIKSVSAAFCVIYRRPVEDYRFYAANSWPKGCVSYLESTYAVQNFTSAFEFSMREVGLKGLVDSFLTLPRHLVCVYKE